MGQLSLRIASSDLSAKCGLQEQPFLLLIAEVLQSLDEHESVKGKRSGVAKEGGLECLVASVQGKIIVKPYYFLGVGSHHVCPRLVKDTWVELHDWIIGDKSQRLLELIKALLAAIEEVRELQQIK